MALPVVAWSGITSYSQSNNGAVDTLLTIPPGSYGSDPFMVFARPFLAASTAPFSDFPSVIVLTLVFTNASILPITTFAQAVAGRSRFYSNALIIPGTSLDQGAAITITSTTVLGSGGAHANHGVFAACVITWDSSSITDPIVAGVTGPNQGFAVVTSQSGGNNIRDGSLAGGFSSFLKWAPPGQFVTGTVVPVASSVPFLVVTEDEHEPAPATSNTQYLSMGIWINQGSFDASYHFIQPGGSPFGTFDFVGGKANWANITGASGAVVSSEAFAVSSESAIGWGFFPTSGAALGRSYATVIG